MVDKKLILYVVVGLLMLYFVSVLSYSFYDL